MAKSFEDKLRQVVSGALKPEAVIKLSAKDALRVGRFGLGLLARGEVEGAEACGHVAARFCPKSPLGWFVLGNAAARRDNDKLALYAYGQALQLAPTLIQLWVDLAELHVRAADYEHAAVALRGALALDPDGKTPPGKRAQLLIGNTFMALTEGRDG